MSLDDAHLYPIYVKPQVATERMKCPVCGKSIRLLSRYMVVSVAFDGGYVVLNLHIKCWRKQLRILYGLTRFWVNKHGHEL